MIRDAVCQRKMKLENPQDALKLRLILDKFSAELFINDGCQTFSTTFYTPLEAIRAKNEVFTTSAEFCTIYTGYTAYLVFTENTEIKNCLHISISAATLRLAVLCMGVLNAVN